MTSSSTSRGGTIGISSSTFSFGNLSMSNAPYPGYPPSYMKVEEMGGYRRNCYVLELFTIGELDPARRAQMEDAIQMAITKFSEVEKHDIIRSQRFDTALRKAMRL